MRFSFSIRVIAFLVVTTACGKHFNATDHSGLQNDFNVGSIVDNGGTLPSNYKPEICSDLSFDHVTWPTGTDEITATLFGLAMNITGSFEGHDGWDNIANNFDGQGLSLGLFNQNFGQGSLQPILMNMHVNARARMTSVLNSAQFTSLESMLKTWNGGAISNVMAKAVPNPATASPLDDPEKLAQAGESAPSLEKASSARNQASVDWAVQNLYSGSSFKTDWKTALQNLSSSPEYISIQIMAARDIHNKAIGYMQKFGFKEMRAYLFFFDIVVQNGSLTSGVESNYLNWVKANAKATETVKLQRMLEYRLALVKSEYIADVRARKTAVILGAGTVHGSKRDFRAEYCAPSWSTEYLDKPLLH